jgi:transposase
MAERGLENVEIANRLHISIPLVGRWRRRYAASSFAGIEKDTTRPPGKPKTTQALVQSILEKTMQETPIAQTHWSQNSMAKATGVSPSTVARIWRAHGLKPHLVRTFKLSNDPLFVEKLEDSLDCTSIHRNMLWFFAPMKKARSKRWTGRNQGYQLNPIGLVR